MQTKPKRVTDRERAIAILRESEDGLSKAELHRRLGNNSGAFRRLVQSMEDKGEVTVTDEDWPNCGLTRVVRAV